MQLTLDVIVRVCEGELVGDAEGVTVSNIVIDSRKAVKGSMFIAFGTGHDYIGSAFTNGAVVCMSEKEAACDRKPVIIVKSCYKAIEKLAKYYRSIYNVKVVAISGSVGKTTTKELVASVLSQRFHVLKTEGNFNNSLGLPLTVFRLEDTHEIAVLEMGMSNFGEISLLSDIAQPDVCLLTNIGVSHIENLGSREGILRAKTEMFDHMKDDGCVILNGDDDMLATVERKDTMFFGAAREIYADQIVKHGLNGSCFRINIKNDFVTDSMIVAIKTPGAHMIGNCMAACAVGVRFGLSLQEIKNGIENAPCKYDGRMDIVRGQRFVMIDDVYNASPDSMKAALAVLCGERPVDDIETSKAARRVCILGDMLELGEFSPDLHYQIGKYACDCGIDVIICCGTAARFMYNAAADSGRNAYYFDNQDKLFAALDKLVCDGDVILVKASRGMKFETIVDKLKQIDEIN